MPAPLCPNCSKPATEAHRPFCSTRCQQLDLGRWLNESYAIPAEESPEGLLNPHDEADEY